jgi:hypothetical protein
MMKKDEKTKVKLGVVVNTYNLSYLGGRGRRITV